MSLANIFNAIGTVGSGLGQQLQQSAEYQRQLQRQQAADEQARQSHQFTLLNHLISLRQAGVDPQAVNAMAGQLGVTVPTYQQPTVTKTPMYGPTMSGAPLPDRVTNGTKTVSLLDMVKPKSEYDYHTGKPGEVVWGTDKSGNVKIAGALPSGNGSKTVTRAIDLGDRVVTYYSDGTSETQAKGAAPRVFAPTAGRPDPQRKTRTVQRADGVYLIDAQTGETISKVSDLPARGGPKSKTDAELRKDVEMALGPMPNKDQELMNPGAQAAWVNRRKAAYLAAKRQRDRQQQQGGGAQTAPKPTGLTPAQQAILNGLAPKKGG